MRVAFVQEGLRHYRAPFFEALRHNLGRDGIELLLFVGAMDDDERLKQDSVELEWAKSISIQRYRVGSRQLVWDGCLRDVRHVDLVIVEQASRRLLNYVLLAWRRLGGPRIAFWGHGRNSATAEASVVGEAVKRVISTAPDWWFTYNDLSAATVERLGFPRSRISTVMNATDTDRLVQWRREAPQREIAAAAASAGLRGANVGVFVGSLYPGKRLDIVIGAAKKIREEMPDFELLVVGAGAEATYVQAQATKNPWIRYVGPKRGVELARLVAASGVIMMPAGVGLVVVEAFALGTPVVAIPALDHGPEIDYIRHGENGWLVDVRPGGRMIEPYAHAVVNILRDDPLRHRLVEGCRRSAETYTLSNMVNRFAEGIRKALHA